MAGQVGEEGGIVQIEGFVRQFWETAVGDTRAIFAGWDLAQLRCLRVS
jgi:hypothetical protein